jgi:hypothetical protein
MSCVSRAPAAFLAAQLWCATGCPGDAEQPHAVRAPAIRLPKAARASAFLGEQAIFLEALAPGDLALQIRNLHPQRVRPGRDPTTSFDLIIC